MATKTRRSSKSSGNRPARGQTRRALLDAALELVQEKGNFSSLSLREVTKRAGVVPTAFYRHFQDMSAMGLTLVDESFSRLRQMMREIRQEGLPTEQIIRSSVETYFNYVNEHALHFQFVSRELFGGAQPIRTAIRQEIRLFTSELATDLSRFPMLNHIGAEDLHMIAGLMVNNMIASTQQMLEIPAEAEEEKRQALDTAEKQMRLIVLGMVQWRSNP